MLVAPTPKLMNLKPAAVDGDVASNITGYQHTQCYLDIGQTGSCVGMLLGCTHDQTPLPLRAYNWGHLRAVEDRDHVC